MVEVLALEEDPRAPGVFGEPRDLGEQARAAGVGQVQPGEFGGELRVVLGLETGLVEFVEGGHEGLGHVPPAELPEAADAGTGRVPEALRQLLGAQRVGAGGAGCVR